MFRKLMLGMGVGVAAAAGARCAFPVRASAGPDQVAVFGDEQRWAKAKRMLIPYIKKRAEYVHTSSLSHFNIREEQFGSLAILDVGCGVGFVAEELARAGGVVHGIDPGKNQVLLATKAASQDPVLNKALTYEATTTEELLKRGESEKYDVIVCSQVLEHVPDYRKIVVEMGKLLKKGGVAFISTDNRTIKAWLWLCVLGEYILRLRPPRTHQWAKLIKPEELKEACEKAGMEVKDAIGFKTSIIRKTCEITPEPRMAYMVMAVKK